MRGASPPGRVRIIGGEWRGRKIPVTSQPGLRPTPDRVRETLFNWLGQRLDGLACLDLFAGSGALGFEAASRGAARVVMVEANRAAFLALEKAKALFSAHAVELHFTDALGYLGRCRERFDVVFLDPPFESGLHASLLERLVPVLSPAGRAYLEAPAPIEASAGWSELRRARAGQVSYQLLQRDGAANGHNGGP